MIHRGGARGSQLALSYDGVGNVPAQAHMTANHVLLVEDDDSMADLLTLLIRTAAPEAEVDRCSDVQSGLHSFSPRRHRLLVCDWNLPGKPGIALVHHIRQQPARIPVLMITGRSDRASVVAARSEGVDGFIVKPFRIEQVLERLRHFLASPTAAELPADPLGHLHALADAALALPCLDTAGRLAAQASGEEVPDLNQLARDWAQQPALVARLLGMANSSLYNPHGRLCGDLKEALQRLGWRTALSIATLQALRAGEQLSDPRLRLRAEAEMDLATRVAEHAVTLARQCGVDPAACQTAAVLHRLGELTVLFHLQEWQRLHGEVSEPVIERALASCARDLAHRLKLHWRYPTPLRELIGAIYQLPPGTSRREKYVLRLAGAAVHGGLDAAEAEKLVRLAKG